MAGDSVLAMVPMTTLPETSPAAEYSLADPMFHAGAPCPFDVELHQSDPIFSHSAKLVPSHQNEMHDDRSRWLPSLHRLKTELERESHRRKTSGASLLEHAARDLLNKSNGEQRLGALAPSKEPTLIVQKTLVRKSEGVCVGVRAAA